MDTSHPGVSLSSYLPQGRRQIRAGAASLRDSFHPQAAPTVSRDPPTPTSRFHPCFYQFLCFSTLSCGFCSITCTIQCIIYMWSLQFKGKKEIIFFVISLTSQSVPELQPEPHLSEVKLWQFLPLQNLPLCIYRL